MIVGQRKVREAKQVDQIENYTDHNDHANQEQNRRVHRDAFDKVENHANEHEAENKSNHKDILLVFYYGRKKNRFQFTMQELVDFITEIYGTRYQECDPD